VLKWLPEKCTGCRQCEIICSLEHYGRINPKRARIRVRSGWPDQMKVLVCKQCRRPACVEACPEGALAKERWITLDEKACTACQLCVGACPFGAVLVGQTSGKPVFCDTCEGNYVCTRWCPPRALQVSGGETNGW